MEPRNIIKSTITAVQAISSIYEAIQDLRDLPNEFKEVNQYLPLAESTLRLTRDHLQGLALDESSEKTIQPLVGSCKEKAKMLQDIFKQVEKGVENAEDGSILDFYGALLLRLGKAHRVESLMQGLLRALAALATNRLFKTATYGQMAKLEDAINQLSMVESSVPDSKFESSGANFTQNIASNGTGYQSHYSGQGQQINTGSGTMNNYSATTMSFAPSNKDDKTQRDIVQTLYTSLRLDKKNRTLDRIPRTCEWFVGHDHYRQWQESKSSSMLWVSANPGCGKSVLTKYLVDEIKTTESRTTCYFFFKDDFEDQRSAKGALSCILHQLFTQRENLFSEDIIRRFKAYPAPLASSYYELWELWDALVTASQDKNAGEIICILDAFDECEDQEQQDLAKPFANSMLKFLVTSRPYDKIRRGFQTLNIPGLPVIHLKGEGDAEVGKIAQEINVYIKDRVSRIRANLHLKANEEQLLLQGLGAIRNQTYLWVYLTLEWIETEISNKINETEIRNVTSTLPRTVDEAYDKILSKSKNPEEAKKLLHIIVAAERPLTLAEIDLALALRQNHRSYKDLDRRPDDRVGRDVRDLCGLFINITDEKLYLIHQTAKEFLVPKHHPDRQEDDMDPRGDDSQRGNNNRLIWKSSLQPSESHRILCQICIWHLLFTEFATHPLDENTDGKASHYLRDNIFLDYSATNWAAHFRASDIEENAVIEPLQRICDAKSRRCLTWFRIYWASTQTTFPLGFTTLMIASYFGLKRIVKLQLRLDDVEIDASDGTYQRSALSWASENGFGDVVELLIKGTKFRLKKLFFPKGAKIDARDIYGRSPLSYACWNGHLAIVQRLVKGGARVDSKDEIGGTPISYALCTGHQDIVKELRKGAQAGSVDEIRRELLLSAAKKGYEPIVKRLLDDGAATEVVDEEGRTPLSWAAEGRQVAVARLLLEKGANVNTNEEDGRTPLARAIDNGSADIIEILLKSGAKVDYSFTIFSPLLRAVENDNSIAVELLLKYGAQPDFHNNYLLTPLHLAEKLQRGAIAEILKYAIQSRTAI
ncbi:putative ankyrin repeat-containing protein [Trichoderma ceciliae]